MTKKLEDNALKDYFKWLKVKGWDTNYYHFPNELPTYDYNMKIFANNLKAKGKKPGFSDILILEQRQGYGALFIELKAKQGRATIEQLVFLNNVNNNGYLGCIAYGLEQAIIITKWYKGEIKGLAPLKKSLQKRQGIEFEVWEVKI